MPRKAQQVALLPYVEPWSLLRDGQSLLSNDGRRFGGSARMTARAVLWIGNQKPDSRHMALGSAFLVWATVSHYSLYKEAAGQLLL